MARLIKVGNYENDSEVWAARFLKERLPDDYLILTNVDVYTENGSRLECDQIIIGVHAVYVVEVKGYTGKVCAGKDLWTFDRGHKPYSSAFVKKTRDKSIILRDRMKRRITAANLHAPWTQHVVFVTGDRGTDLELELENPAEPICSPEDIVDRLTLPEQLTGNFYHGTLTEDQIALAEREIAAIAELKRIPIQWGSFTDITMLGCDGPYVVSKGTLRVDEFRQDFLLRVLEKSTGTDRAAYAEYLNGLTEEASIYRELAGVPGVPYVAPLQEDDERVVFAISWPRGKSLSEFESGDVTVERRLGILRAVSSTVGGVHGRGMVHGRLDPQWIYVTEAGEIQILNFSASIGGACPFPAPEAAEGRLTAASDVFSLARMFAPWFGQISEDDAFVPNESLASTHGPVFDWLAAALESDPADRPRLDDLVRTLRRMELGIAPIAAASEEPFEREPGAVLHGTYRLEDSLGSGPAGDVWRARHDRGSYPLALHFADRRNEQFLRARFEEVAALHHPMIVRSYDMRRVPGQDALYMAAEWLNGDPVDQLLEAGKLPDQAVVLAWFRDLLIALEFVHGQGVLHRNISPDAIVIVDGRPRLVEFSLLPDTERRAGLIEYSDPRVSEAGWSRESDLYALTATFLSLLAGITPRTSRGTVLDAAQIEKAVLSGLPAEVRRGLLEVLSPEFELQTDRYAELFGIQEPPKALDRLPDEFLGHWEISRGHQERVARFLINEFHGNHKAKARQRSRVVQGSIALSDVSANKTMRAAANSAISALIKTGVIDKPKKRSGAVRPSSEFIESWARESK